MSFPRTNFSNLNSHEQGEADRFESARNNTATARQPHPAAAPGRDSWGATRQATQAHSKPGTDEFFTRSPLQDHFFLAPNVRFTRTPEREMPKRRAEQQGSEENAGQRESTANMAAAQRPAAQAASPAPSIARTATPTNGLASGAATVQPAAADAAARRETRTMPAAKTPSLERVVEKAQVLSSAANVAVPVAPQVAEEAPVSQPVEVEVRTDSSGAFWSCLSDHAFFEFLPPEGMVELAPLPTIDLGRFAVAAAPATPLPQQTRPAQVAEITSLFRIIECTPAAPASPALPEAAVAAAIPAEGEKNVEVSTNATVQETQVAAAIRTEEIVAAAPVVEAVATAPAAETASTPAEAIAVPSPADAAAGPAAEAVAPVAEAVVAAPAAKVATPAVTAGAAPAPKNVVAPVAANANVVAFEPAKKASVTMPVPVARATSPRTITVGAEQPGTEDGYEFPSEELLQEPPVGQGFYMSQERLEQNADLLESVLEDFGVKGEIIHVRPGPVVTLYEFEPAPGVKSSRVIGLADDIARSMSAISARVAVVPGRNVIGIELPNETRETVYFRELIESHDFRETGCKLALCLGKTIGGEPVIAELAKMPHLLVAGTTGSGKSVAINTMILSLLYRMTPQECRLIMVDPKMLELSVYDGIPHLLTPVVTDPKKAVTALKWAVREMEDRYRKMARLGVRNIDGYNQRAAVARDKGETVVMQVQTGFEKGTGAPLFEEQEIDLAPMPYIVVIVDEMADLMMVAGKEIEGAIQRLAQMARAAGIHLIMATQRPSVDVITGTIKANFPTRISFQVTSKIDSRTILGEQGAEQLLGQGDMLHMAGGGRIARVHGPFVSDDEVEQVVAHLKTQGRPEYLETVTADEEEEEADADQAVFDKGSVAAEDSDSTYDEAVKVVLRDKKCSTSYIQRRLGIGYNRAASLVERMEKEGIVGAPNHVGKREILLGRRDHAAAPDKDDMD